MTEVFKLTPALEIVKYLDDLIALKELNIFHKFIQENVVEAFKTFETRSLKISSGTKIESHHLPNLGPKRILMVWDVNDEKNSLSSDEFPKNFSMKVLVEELKNSGYLVAVRCVIRDDPVNITVSLPGENIIAGVEFPAKPEPVKLSAFEEYYSGISNPKLLKKFSDDTTQSLKRIIDTTDYKDFAFFKSELCKHDYGNGFDNTDLLIHSIFANNIFITRFLLEKGLFQKRNVDYLVNLAISHDRKDALGVLHEFAEKFTQV